VFLFQLSKSSLKCGKFLQQRLEQISMKFMIELVNCIGRSLTEIDGSSVIAIVVYLDLAFLLLYFCSLCFSRLMFKMRKFV
jgi:hypothetical protein